METIRIKDTIDLNCLLNEWNEATNESDIQSDVKWELKYYPILNDFLVIVFECETDNEKEITYRYRILLYDLKQCKLLDKIYNVELKNMMCCTVLDINDENILINVWDFVSDKNIVCIRNEKNVVIECGYGVSCSAPVFGSNKIAVGYGYEAVNEHNVAPVKIFNRNNGKISYEYKNPKVLGCDDIYTEKNGVVWASFWGENRIVKITESESIEYESEMSGFDSFVITDENKTLYVVYEFSYCGDKIFKLEYNGKRYVYTNEIKVILLNNKGEEEAISVKNLSAENGYVACLIDENVIGILDM